MSSESNLKKQAEETTFEDSRFDDATFEAFFKAYFHPLCSFCRYKFEFDIDVAKETVHTAFLRLWENRAAISPDLSLKAYMYKVVNNICLDILKHQKVKEQFETYTIRNTQSNFLNSNYASADFKELRNAIDKAIFGLPDQMRTVFELSRYEGLKYFEIANHLGLSIKTVETQMSRALAKLRCSLANYLSLPLAICLTGM